MDIYRVVKIIDSKKNIALGHDLETDEDIFIKSAKIDAFSICETMALEELHGAVGFPFLHWHGEVDGEMKIITDPFGLSLEQHFHQSTLKFDLQTVSTLAQQLISRVESMHQRSLMHISLTPETFSFGYHDWQGSQLQVTDLAHVVRDGSMVKENLLSVGYIIAYLCDKPCSWAEFQQKELHSKLAKAPVAVSQYLEAVESMPKPNYMELKKIFQRLSEQLNLQQTLSQADIELANPAIPIEIRQLDTGILFDALKSMFSTIGAMSQTGPSDWPKVKIQPILKSLPRLLALYKELLLRRRSSSSVANPLLHHHVHPTGFWREIKWFLQVSEEWGSPFREAIVKQLYQFLTVLFEILPNERVYWAQYLLHLSRLMAELRGYELFWKRISYFWHNELNITLAERAPLASPRLVGEEIFEM